MVERRGRARLAAKALERLRRHGGAAGQDLDRDDPLETRVPGPIHSPMPPAPSSDST